MNSKRNLSSDSENDDSQPKSRARIDDKGSPEDSLVPALVVSVEQSDKSSTHITEVSTPIDHTSPAVNSQTSETINVNHLN